MNLPASWRSQWLRGLAIAAPFAVFIAVYLPQSRFGLMLDDFGWILHSRARSIADVLSLLRSSDGFYRPIVALTFTLNEWTFGTSAFGYGVTNVALALICAIGVGSLARGISMPRGAALVAASVWLLNFHGIRTAVLWTSGRTALVLIASATLSAAAVARGRPLMALGWLVVALFSKEEGVLLPIVCWTWILVLGSLRHQRPMSATVWVLGSCVAEAVYFLARTSSGAMTPATAPEHYRFTLSLGQLLRNASIYADFCATTSAVVLVLAFVALGTPRPLLDRQTRHMLLLAATWVIGTFALTLPVPSRSDLYACLPSIGPCLIVGLLAARSWEQASLSRRRLAQIAIVVCLVLVSPVYRARTERRAELQRFATTVLAGLLRETRALPAGAVVELWDDPLSTRRNAPPNLADAFGSQIEDAFELESGRRLALRVVEPLENEQPPESSCEGCALRLVVVGGRLQPR